MSKRHRQEADTEEALPRTVEGMASDKSFSSQRRTAEARGRREPRPELKNFDKYHVHLDDVPASSAGLSIVNAVPQGASSQERIGRRAQMKSVRVRGVINVKQQMHTDSNIQYNYDNLFRVALVLDKQPGAVKPHYQDIFGIETQSAFVSGCDALTNLKNADRFRVLRDEFIPANLVTGALQRTTGTNTAYFEVNNLYKIDMFVKLNTPVTFIGPGSNPGVVADVATNAIYVVAFRYRPNWGPVGNQIYTSNAQFWTRVRFTDQ